jgi:hypothetical protein
MTAILGDRGPADRDCDRGGRPGQAKDHNLEALAVQQVVARASVDAPDRGILPRRAPGRWRIEATLEQSGREKLLGAGPVVEQLAGTP